MTDERRTVEQRLGQVLDSHRGRSDPAEMADVLLWNAVEWRTGTTGLPAPELEDLQRVAESARRRFPEFGSLLDSELQELSSYTPTQLRHYARLLLRPSLFSDHRSEFTTSDSLVDVARTALAAYAHDSRAETAHLYDPVCGSATLALDAAQALAGQTGRAVTVEGQDINAAAVQRARAHAFLLGTDARFSLADSLSQDAFPDRRFDYTVADIPYNLSWRNSNEECTAEADRPGGRYPSGLPAPGDASLLFAQILVSKLRDPADGGGRGVMFTTAGPLYDAGGNAIRTWLLDQDLLDAVIVLPEGLSASPGLRLYGLVFSNRKPAARRRKVQFIDLRGFYQDGDARRLERRTISGAALDELSRSLKHAKPTAYSRTAAAKDLSFRQVGVAHHATAVTSRYEPGDVPRLTMLLPAISTTEAWRDNRYATVPPTVTDITRPPLTRFDVNRVFTTDRTPRALRALTQIGWKTARLTELTEHLCYIPSTKAAERAAMLSAVAGEQALVVPIEPHLDAVTGDPGEVAPDNRALVIRPRAAYTEAEYLAGWLNSPLGRHLRSTAVGAGGDSYVSPRTINLNQAWRMADELLVALPDLPIQREMARAERALVAARRHLVDSHRELWNDPKKRSDIFRKASSLIPSADLAQWATTLPFPMASSLWTYESKGSHNLHARREQMFHFWEATIQFHATAIVSALLQDNSRLNQELSTLAKQIRLAGLTPERATLGVWHIILQRLSKRFRTALIGTDIDEQARARAAFADAPPEFLETLLSPDLTNLFGEVIQRRNAWSGHSGTTTAESLKEQLDILTGHVHTLRNLIGAGWQDFPLVRAGAARIRNRVFHHDVDLAMGPNAPFRQEQIPISVAMEEDGLYLLSREAGSAIPLAPLIVMHPAAFGSNSGCYYFNRLQPEGVRFVAYHEAAEPERIEDALPTVALAAALRFDKEATNKESQGSSD